MATCKHLRVHMWIAVVTSLNVETCLSKDYHLAIDVRLDGKEVPQEDPIFTKVSSCKEMNELITMGLNKIRSKIQENKANCHFVNQNKTDPDPPITPPPPTEVANGTNVIQEGKVCEYTYVQKCLTLNCSDGTTIEIINATYGRNEIIPTEQLGNVDDEARCTFPSKAEGGRADEICNAEMTLNATRKICDGKSECKLKASNEQGLYGGDPCSQIFKYLWVQWRCET